VEQGAKKKLTLPNVGSVLSMCHSLATPSGGCESRDSLYAVPYQEFL
jgi:hypothetical protein